MELVGQVGMQRLGEGIHDLKKLIGFEIACAAVNIHKVHVTCEALQAVVERS